MSLRHEPFEECRCCDRAAEDIGLYKREILSASATVHIGTKEIFVHPAIKDEIQRLTNSYRCFSCKQVFEEILAKEHFGSHLNGDNPKCWEILAGTATWGGGPHDPFYRMRKEQFDAMETEIITLKARCARYEAHAEADADQL